MNKSKVTLSLLSIAIISAVAYSQFTDQQPEPKPEIVTAETPAPVSIPAPTQRQSKAPTTVAKKELDTVFLPTPTTSSVTSQAPAPKKAMSQTRSSLTARQQDLAKDHRDQYQQARPHGHEDHHSHEQAKRPPGEPKKPVPSNAPKG